MPVPPLVTACSKRLVGNGRFTEEALAELVDELAVEPVPA